MFVCFFVCFFSYCSSFTFVHKCTQWVVYVLIAATCLFVFQSVDVVLSLLLLFSRVAAALTAVGSESWTRHCMCAFFV